MLTRPYVDVTFTGIKPGGTLTGIDGDEILLSGPGADNLDLVNRRIVFDSTGGASAHTGPELLNGTTYRYYVHAKSTVTDQTQLFKNGAITIEFPAGAWGVHYATNPSNDASAGRGSATFTVNSQATDSGTATTPFSLGPLSIAGPSVSLVDTKFKGGKLTLTIGIGADSASLAFGSTNGQQTAGQSSNGITATLTGILVTFDVQVDVMQAVQSVGLAELFTSVSFCCF